MSENNDLLLKFRKMIENTKKRQVMQNNVLHDPETEIIPDSKLDESPSIVKLPQNQTKQNINRDEIKNENQPEKTTSSENNKKVSTLSIPPNQKHCLYKINRLFNNDQKNFIQPSFIKGIPSIDQQVSESSEEEQSIADVDKIKEKQLEDNIPVLDTNDPTYTEDMNKSEPRKCVYSQPRIIPGKERTSTNNEKIFSDFTDLKKTVENEDLTQLPQNPTILPNSSDGVQSEVHIPVLDTNDPTYTEDMNKSEPRKCVYSQPRIIPGKERTSTNNEKIFSDFTDLKKTVENEDLTQLPQNPTILPNSSNGQQSEVHIPILNTNDPTYTEDMNKSEPRKCVYSQPRIIPGKERTSTNNEKIFSDFTGLKKTVENEDLTQLPQNPTILPNSSDGVQSEVQIAPNPVIVSQPRRSVKEMILENEKRIKQKAEEKERKTRNSTIPSYNLSRKLNEMKHFIEKEKSTCESFSDFYQLNRNKLEELGITNENDFSTVSDLIEYFENCVKNSQKPVPKAINEDAGKKRNTITTIGHPKTIEFNVPAIKEENDEEINSFVESITKTEKKSSYVKDKSVLEMDKESIIEDARQIASEENKNQSETPNFLKEKNENGIATEKKVLGMDSTNMNILIKQEEERTISMLERSPNEIQKVASFSEIEENTGDQTFTQCSISQRERFSFNSAEKIMHKKVSTLQVQQENTINMLFPETFGIVPLQVDDCSSLVSFQITKSRTDEVNKRKIEERNKQLLMQRLIDISIVPQPFLITSKIIEQTANFDYASPSNPKLMIANVCNIDSWPINKQNINTNIIAQNELKQEIVSVNENFHNEPCKNETEERKEPVTKEQTNSSEIERNIPSSQISQALTNDNKIVPADKYYSNKIQNSNLIEATEKICPHLPTSKDININYKKNIISSLDSIAVVNYTFNSLIPFDPSFLDILCTNCFDCIKISEADLHSQICVIRSEEFYCENEDNIDYNSRIFKLLESLKNKKNEIINTQEDLLISIYEELVGLVFEILINNNSIEELDQSISKINHLLNIKLPNVKSNNKIQFLIFGNRLSQLVYIKLKDMEKILLMVEAENNDNLSANCSFDIEKREDDDEDDENSEQIKYLKMQLADIDNKTLQAQLELKQWKREAKMLEKNLRKPIQNAEGLSDIVSDVISRKDESVDKMSIVTGQTSEVDPTHDIANMKDLEGIAENEEEAKKYFLSIGLELKFKHSEKIKNKISFANLYDKAKLKKIPISEWYNFIFQELIMEN